jgi:hypothetical protein
MRVFSIIHTIDTHCKSKLQNEAYECIASKKTYHPELNQDSTLLRNNYLQQAINEYALRF